MMPIQSVSVGRRNFLCFNLIAAATAVLGSVIQSRPAHAIMKRGPAGVPLLSPEDAQAKALSYVTDVKTVDSESLKLSTSPAVAGQKCGNCQLYSGSPGTEWGPCAIFSYRVDPDTNRNFVVSADGWCRSWAPRAG